MVARSRRSHAHMLTMLKKYDTLTTEQKEELYHYVTNNDTYSFTHALYWINHIEDHMMDVLNFELSRSSNNSKHRRYQLIMECSEDKLPIIKRRLFEEFMLNNEIEEEVNTIVKRINNSLHRDKNFFELMSTCVYLPYNRNDYTPENISFLKKYVGKKYTVEDFYEGISEEYKLGVIL